MSKNFKYLGMTIDAPTLTWKDHTDDLLTQTNQRLNIMRALAGTTWGAEREILLRIYTAYIRPKMTYGAAAYASVCDTRLGRLEGIQNTALRIAVGARKTSPIAALQVEANIPPLKLYIKEACCNYYYKLKTLEDHLPLSTLMMTLTPEIRSGQEEILRNSSSREPGKHYTNGSYQTTWMSVTRHSLSNHHGTTSK